MLRYIDMAVRQGQRRPGGSVTDFGVVQLEPRVLLSATGSEWTEPTGDSGLLAQEEPSGSVSAMSFSMSWDEPIAAPSDLAATALSSTAIRLTWSDNSHNETGFGVFKWISGRFQRIAEVGANVTEYVDAGLAPGTSYLYQVYAYNDYNASPMSASVTGTTVPLAPTYLTAMAVSSGQIELLWTGSSGATGYQVERSLDGISGWLLVGTTDSFTWDLTDSGLAPGTTYHYRVMAVNDGGLSVASLSASATTEQAAVDGPTAPLNLAASVFGHKHVRLTWTPVEAATGYAIERSDNGGAWKQVGLITAELPEFKDHWVSVDGTHAYRVRTISGSESSVPSNEAIVSTGRTTVLATATTGKRFSLEPIVAMADDQDSITGVLLGKKK
jgi:fibronectin type 3 domain-containing protein